MSIKNAGGIVGVASANSGGITGCAALSGSITCEGSGTAKRIVEVNSVFSLTDNITSSDMPVNSATVSGSAADVNGADKTAAKLELQATYTALGWDFNTVWKMQGTRPVLQWQ